MALLMTPSEDELDITGVTFVYYAEATSMNDVNVDYKNGQAELSTVKLQHKG